MSPQLPPTEDTLVDASGSRSTGVIAATQAAATGPSPGGRIGRYEIRRVLGMGGMGVVYGAWDPELDRRVAIKVVQSNDDKAQARLLREARALARLSHPNVVSIYDVGVHGTGVFVAMELVVGKTLDEHLAAADPSWRDCVALFIDAGRGLAAAHARGLVHRDFKPGNVMVTEDGRVQVLDFGLAFAEEREDTFEDLGSDDAESNEDLAGSLTRTGAILGTPAYMAPEQLFRGGVDARCDQFSFCVALWEALGGERPFAGTSVRQLMRNLARGHRQPFPEAARAELPRALILILERGLAHDSAQRWPDMDSLLAELERVAAPRGRLWAGLALALGALALGAGLTWGLTRGAGDQGQLCLDAPAELAEVWSASKASLIETAMAEAALPEDEIQVEWTQLREGIDAWAARWRGEHEALCEAVRAEQLPPADYHLRVSCLDRKLSSAGYLIDYLTTLDPEEVEGAHEYADELPVFDECEDAELLRIRYGTEVASGEFAKRIDYASHLRMIGEYDQSFAEAEALVVGLELEAATKPALLGQALFARGEAHRLLGALDLAYEDLFRAATMHQRAGSLYGAAQAFSKLAEIDTARGDYTSARRWLDLSLATDDADPTIKGWLHNRNLSAGLALHEGDYERALTEFRGILADMEAAQAQGDDSYAKDTTAIAYNIASSLSSLGRYEEAIVELERAIEQAIAGGLAEDSVEVGQRLAAIANNERQLGRLDDSLEHHTRALEVLARNVDEEHPLVIGARLMRLETLEELGRCEQARAEADALAALTREIYGPRASRTLWATELQARACDFSAPGAVELLDSVSEQRAQRGPDSARHRSHQTLRGWALLKAGRHAQAREAFEAIEPTTSMRGFHHAGLALTLAALEDRAGACAQLQHVDDAAQGLGRRQRRAALAALEDCRDAPP